MGHLLVLFNYNASDTGPYILGSKIKVKTNK